MSLTVLQGDSKPFRKGTFFENNGIEYTIAVIPVGDSFHVVIRERKTNAFVKEFKNMTAEDVEKIQKKIERFTNVVHLYDVLDMRVLDAIEQYIAQYGQTPTYATLAARLHATYTEISSSMARLAAKGFVETSYHNKKGFKLLRHRRDA